VHITKLTLVNYRNFANTTLIFQKGVNTLIGENGSGKTNVFRAIRLLLDDNMVRAAYKLDEGDFHRGLGRWQGHWIIISMEFEEISSDEAIQALFLHGTGMLEEEVVNKASYTLAFRPRKDVRLALAALEDFDLAGMNAILARITIEDYETVFLGRGSADFSNPAVYRQIVGDFDNACFSDKIDVAELGTKVPGVLAVTKEVSLTFIQALRDVVDEFRNNRTNPLLTLLKGKSGQLDPAQLVPIVQQVRTLNEAIEGLDDVQAVRTHIRETIHEAAGQTYSPALLSIKSELPDEADRLFQSLKLFVGESDEGYEGPIHELSLGGANLIFLTLKLLEFRYQRERQAVANFLLIEEPEAHLHTHVQKTLFDRIEYAGAQIIYSTHSTHISEVSKVTHVNILGRTGSHCEAYHPSAGLEQEQIGNVQRYLDAVRSNLLFAKSVLLVEGDAEEILIPILVKKVLGVSLDELGISLINIRSTGFQNVAVLFDDLRIRRRCSIVTDLDAAFMGLTELPTDDPDILKLKRKLAGSQESGATRKVVLDGMTARSTWLRAFFAQHTFEVDFLAAGNATETLNVVNDVYVHSPTRALAQAELISGHPGMAARRMLMMASYQGKGWFAILLGKQIQWSTLIPGYIRSALLFAHGGFSNELLFNILKHRIKHIDGAGLIARPVLQGYWERLLQFRDGRSDLATLNADTQVSLAGDQINLLLTELA
jgi:putative ATP-dependent endonuclease of the OLD family